MKKLTALLTGLVFLSSAATALAVGPPPSAPDTTATAGLLGISLVALMIARRFRK